MSVSNIIQANPKAAYLARKAEIDAAVARVLGSGWYILGREVEAFEREFAEWLGGPQVLGVANGTDAIELVLRGLGVGAGDLVFTVSHTAVATVAAIECAGAIPVLADVDPDTYCLSPDSLRRAVTAALDGTLGVAGTPKAVVAVHLYGHMADLDGIGAVCREFGLHLIEDCAQAHGAELNGRKAGTTGIAGTFSFYPTKNLGAIGDGGGVCTSDPALMSEMTALRQYGWRERYISSSAGINTRLDEMQAAILRAKLPDLDADNAARRGIAARYDAALDGSAVIRPTVKPGVTHVYHQYVVQAEDRDGLAAFLKARGIGSAIHYPKGVHAQSGYAGRTPTVPGGLPVTEALTGRILSLPMYPQLGEAEVERVCAALREYSGRAGA